MAADGAGCLPERGHRESSLPCRCPRKQTWETSRERQRTVSAIYKEVRTRTSTRWYSRLKSTARPPATCGERFAIREASHPARNQRVAGRNGRLGVAPRGWAAKSERNSQNRVQASQRNLQPSGTANPRIMEAHSPPLWHPGCVFANAEKAETKGQNPHSPDSAFRRIFA